MQKLEKANREALTYESLMARNKRIQEKIIELDTLDTEARRSGFMDETTYTINCALSSKTKETFNSIWKDHSALLTAANAAFKKNPLNIQAIGVYRHVIADVNRQLGEIEDAADLIITAIKSLLRKNKIKSGWN